MAAISAYDSNSISTLLSSLNTGSSSSNTSINFGVNLSDYATIKSGSYFKLLKAYYGTEGTSGFESIKPKTSTSTSEDSTKTLASVENAADSLSETAQDLYKNSSLFNKKTVKNEDGTTTTGYDTDAIYKKVSAFVEDYNALVKAGGSANTSSIVNSVSSMTNNTNANASALKGIGITIDSEKKTLSIDEEKFKKADMNTVKSLFNGTGSFAYSTAVRASMISSYAQSESSKSNTYNSSGNYTYNYNSGNIYSGYM